MPDGGVRIAGAAAPVLQSAAAAARDGLRVGVANAPRVFALGAAVLVSALALAWLQPPQGGGILAGVALIPWLTVLRHHGALAGAASGLAFGTLTGVAGIPWMPAGLERLGMAPGNAMLATGLLALWASGVPWAAFGLVAASTRRLSPPLWCAALAMAAWGIDSIRSDSALGFPWALVGHTQASVPGVAQLALLGGVPLVSALVVALAAAGACAIAARGGAVHGRVAPLLAVVTGAYAALAALGLPVAAALREALEPPGLPALDVLVVQPNLHPIERWQARVQRTNLAIVAAETVRALEASRADLVVWPENTLTTPLETNPVLAAELRERVDTLGVPVVLGAVREGDLPERQRTSALWIVPGRGIVDAVDKTRAIPVVETGGTSGWLRGLAGLLGLGAERRLVAEGREERALRDPGDHELVPALCYEMLFPGLVAARRTERSSAILNLGNDSWFLSAAPSGHQIAIASFRAIEQRLFVVRAVHGGASAVLDPFGRVVGSLPFGQRGALAARIVPQAPPHPIERAGIGALALGGGGLGLLVSFRLFGRKAP